MSKAIGALLVSLVFLCCGAAYAQQGKPAQIEFHLESQPLPDAVAAWAQQAGLQLVWPVGDAVGKQMAPRVAGLYDREEALRLILVGTGLTYSFVNPDTIAIRQGLVSGQTEERGAINVVQAEIPSAGAQGESARKAASATPSKGGDTGSISEIVVTAQKRTERLQDVPISMSVLSGEELNRSTDRGLMETLTRVPGVAIDVNSQGGGPQITVRGVGAPNALFLGSSPIAYYLDAVPFSLVRSAITPDTSVYDMERVEVLRGPQGTLYGASAQNGVVRVLTRDADLNDFQVLSRASLATTKWGAESYRGDIAVNVPIIEDRLAIRAVAGYQDASGWIDGPTGRDLNDGQLQNLRLKVNAQPTEALSIRGSAWLSRSDYGAPTASNDAHQRFALVDEPMENDFDIFALTVGYDFSAFTVTSTTSHIDYSVRSRLDLSGIPLANSIGITNLDATVFTEEVNVNSTHQGPWRWNLGAIYRDAKDGFFQDRLSYTGTRRTDQYVLPADVRFGSESYAMYGQLTRLLFDDRFELTAGLRYFKDDVTLREVSRLSAIPPGGGLINRGDEFDEVSPRLSMTWHPSRQLTLYASYAEGFRSGAQQLPTVLAVAPNLPTAEPDNLRNYELGTHGSISGGRLSFDAAVYYMDWQDVQQPITVAVPPTSFQATIINGVSASGFGFDFGFSARPTDRVTLDFGFSVNDLTQDEDVLSRGIVLFREGERLNLSPRYTVNGSAAYNIPIGHGGYEAQFSISGNYTSERAYRALAGTTVRLGPGDSLSTLGARIAVVSPRRWTASLFAENLTNEYGVVRTDVFFPNGGQNSRVRPTTIGAQIEYRFD